MRSILLSAIAAAVASLVAMTFPPSPAAAFGDFFDRGGANCDLPAHARVIERTVRRHTVKRPGVYVLDREPGLYGWKRVKVKLRSGRVVWARRRVLIRSYRNVNRYHPGKRRWTHEHQHIVTVAPPRPRGAWPAGC